MSITIQNLNKHFGNFHALKNINLNVPTGKLVSLLGPSGCGKTTLLRIIAGLENADGGNILFDGQDVTAKHVRERKVGFVFQHYALFRHMNVFDNVAFGLTVLPKSERPSKEQICTKVEELLKLDNSRIWQNPIRTNSPAGNASASPSPVRLRSNRNSCFWTNPSARWMPKYAKNYAPGCATSITTWV